MLAPEQLQWTILWVLMTEFNKKVILKGRNDNIF